MSSTKQINQIAYVGKAEAFQQARRRPGVFDEFAEASVYLRIYSTHYYPT